jgi:hypothetical protein
MNPLMNLYMRQMAAQGGRMGFQGGGMDAGAGSADQGAGAGISAGVAKGMGLGPQQGDKSNLKGDPTTDTMVEDESKKGLLDYGKDVSKFAFNPALAVMSAVTGLPIGLGLGIASALGMNVDMGPAPDMGPDKGGRADERMIAQIPQQTVPVQLFDGDTIKLQRYEDFMKAGYPADMAEYLVNQLV